MNLDSQKFSREYLEKISVSERKTLLLEMSIVLSQFISDENFDQNIKESIEEPRKIGHDLWCFDLSDEFQAWCGNWTEKEKAGKLFLQFHKYNPVSVSWSYNE
jgi:hypothetical protein